MRKLNLNLYSIVFTHLSLELHVVQFIDFYCNSVPCQYFESLIFIILLDNRIISTIVLDKYLGLKNQVGEQ